MWIWANTLYVCAVETHFQMYILFSFRPGCITQSVHGYILIYYGDAPALGNMMALVGLNVLYILII